MNLWRIIITLLPFIVVLIISGGILYFILTIPEVEDKPQANQNNEDIKEMDCEELLYNHDLCKYQSLINWIQVCRGNYLPYIYIECKKDVFG